MSETSRSNAQFPERELSGIRLRQLAFVTLAGRLSRHVTDNVTDVLEKNLGKTVFACRAVVLLTKAGHAVTHKKGGATPPLPLN